MNIELCVDGLPLARYENAGEAVVYRADRQQTLIVMDTIWPAIQNGLLHTCSLYAKRRFHCKTQPNDLKYGRRIILGFN